MTDIVERLRYSWRHVSEIDKAKIDLSLLLSAADEIARLRSKNTELNRRCQEAESAIHDYGKLIATPPDGDGLRFVSGSLGRALMVGLAVKQYDEIERLRGLLGEAADDIEHWGGYASEYFKDKWHLEDDIKKYRDAALAGAAVQPSGVAEEKL